MTKRLVSFVFFFLIVISFILVIFMYPKIKMTNIYNVYDYPDSAYIQFPDFYVRNVVSMDDNNIELPVHSTVTSSILSYDSYDVNLYMPFVFDGHTFKTIADYLDYCFANNLNSFESTITTQDYDVQSYGGYLPSAWPTVIHNEPKYSWLVGYVTGNQGGRGGQWINYTDMPFSYADITTYVGTPYEKVENSGDYYIVIDYTFSDVKVVPNGFLFMLAFDNYTHYVDSCKPETKSFDFNSDSFFDNVDDFFETIGSYIVYPFKWLVFGFNQVKFASSAFSCFL